MPVKYHGKNGVVYVSVSGAVAAINVGAIRGFTLDLNTDLVDVTEFAQGNKTFVQGFPNYQGTLDGFWASDVGTIQAAAQAADGTNIYLYPSNNAVTRYIGGPAWLNMSIRSAVDQAVAMPANFSARGAWVNNL
jgi:hypothetical protein